jgi:hypothetical protein
MAIIGSIFALAGRFAGRFVNALLGWATILLFGRLESRRQTVMAYIALASLLWVATIAGLLVPDVGTFLIAAVPRPDFVGEDLVRWGMLIAVVTIPLIVGAVGVWLTEARSRPLGVVAIVKDTLRGYPFTALLALTIAFLAAIAFVRKVKSLSRRWSDAHLPVVVKPNAYERVVHDLSEVLAEAGLDIELRPAPRALTAPAKLLDRVAGRTLGGMVPDRLVLLVRPGLEILVYPSDVAISGERRTVARSRAAIASRLIAAPAWLTTSAEAQAIEDMIRATLQAPSLERRARALEVIDRRLASTTISFDEWETLYRQRLQAGLLAGREPDASVDRLEPEPASPVAPAWERHLRGAGGALALVGVVGLLVLDVALTAKGRDDP